RRALYEQVADAHLPPLARGGATKALDALRALAGAPRGTRLLWATSNAGEYPVVIGRGLLSATQASRLAELWPLDSSASRPFYVTDETVAALYGERLAHAAATIAIPPGEQQKTLAGAERVLRALVAAGAPAPGPAAAPGRGRARGRAGGCRAP